MTLPSTSPGEWCTMHATKQTRWSMRALTTSYLISSTSPSQMRKENANVVSNQPMKINTWEMSMKAEWWAEHYERLLNVSSSGTLKPAQQTAARRPAIPITIDMVKKVISKIKLGKATSPSGIELEMNGAAGHTGATMIWDYVQFFMMAWSKVTGSKCSFSVITRARVMPWTKATITASSWPNMSWRS